MSERAGQSDFAKRRTGTAGLVFAVLVLAAFAVGTGPEADRTDQEILDFFEDDANQAKQFVSTVLLGIAGIAFLAFLTGLRDVFAEAGADAWWSRLAQGSGLVFLALLYVQSAIGGAAIAATYEFSERFELDPQTARLFLTAGNLGLSTAMSVALVPLVFATSLLGRRTEIVPTWVSWFGYGAAVVGLFSALLFGLPIALMTLWMLCVSVAFLRHKGAGERG